MEWEPTIGLEVHVQLSTQSKIFSGASTGYGAEPNTQACALDLGLPGTLPVLNQETIHMGIKFGLAVQANITEITIFDRKNYFYPDLPKGYQISQHTDPLIRDGYLDIFFEDHTSKRINITCAHLEEDAGKSLHEDFHGMTGIDLNRAGTPLLEIVSGPDMHSAKEAVTYLKTLHSLVRSLGISDANMQEGSFRCDANVSVAPKGEKKLGTRTEIKNINSFRFVERAINYEIERQIKEIENGETINQETRLYDSEKHETRAMRNKEEANDYRFFPEPDLLPVKITPEMIEKARADLPELPQEKTKRFMREYRLTSDDAHLLAVDQDMANYFEKVIQVNHTQPKTVVNWMMGELSAAMNKTGVNIINCPISAKQFAHLLERIDDHTISGKIAKSVFDSLWNHEGEVDEIIEKKGLKQLTDHTSIDIMVKDVLKTHHLKVKKYLNGKTQLFGFFVGEVMRISKGKANPKLVNELLTANLEKEKGE